MDTIEVGARVQGKGGNFLACFTLKQTSSSWLEKEFLVSTELNKEMSQLRVEG